jgi:lipopolysaccharide transport system ATP-binding protein
MSSEIAIAVEGLSKCYQIYDQPRDRLKQFVLPRIQRFLGQASRQYFQEFWALNDVSLEINKGETVGIIGRNGSGKSTLLQAICGTLTPSSGSIQTRGRIAALLELGAGFNPEFTGRENVFLHSAVLGVPAEVTHERIDKVIEFSGLNEFIDRPIKTYSSGMYARLAFSAAIHVDPSILIVDEALSVGDAGFQLKCMLRMYELKENGVTILFVSHDSASVVRLCNRAFVMERGRVVFQDRNPRECISYYERLTRKTAISTTKGTQPFAMDAADTSYADELQGITETRLGSQEARYLSVDFLGNDGKAREVFHSGDEIQIRALVSSKRHVSEAVSGVSLMNRQGDLVWGDNTLNAKLPLSLEPGLSYITYRFCLNIPAGEYFLYIGLADISGERLELDQRWPIRRMTVISDRESIGFVYAPAAVEHIPVNIERGLAQA